MGHWRAKFGENNRYVEQRLLFSAEGSSFDKPKRDGDTLNYIKMAYDISSEMTPGGKDALKVFDSREAIRAELGIPSSLPSSSVSKEEEKEKSTLRGYISDDCGWADAISSIEWLRQEVMRLGRVEIRTGLVESLVFTDDRQQVQGVKLDDGTVLTADLTIVAAGSQSPHLLGIPDLCDVYSEVTAYIQLTEDESKELRRRKWPILVNAHRGVFAVGPDHDNCLKLGHFSYSGMADVLHYAGIEVPPRPELPKSRKNPNFGWGGDVELSKLGDVEDYESAQMHQTLADYRLFLLELLGPSAFEGITSLGKVKTDIVLNNIANRPFSRLRKCWYSDTPSLDFIVDYHPSYSKTLFVASGGCDHAFKFLPVIGEKVVAIALHHRGVESSFAPEISPPLEELTRLWKFPVELLQQGQA